MAVPQPTDQGQDDATGQPHQQRDPDLPEEDLPHVGLLDRAGREPADDQGRGLQTDVAAHGGDDGNKATIATTSWNVKRDSQRIAPETRLPIRLVNNHGSRSRAAAMLEDLDCVSSSRAPAIFSMSSVASSRITSTTSSTVMMPTSVLSFSTTGMASRL